MKWIVAPSYLAAEDYCRREGIDQREARFVSGPETLRGQSVFPWDVVYLDQWTNRRDAYEIHLALEIAAIRAGAS